MADNITDWDDAYANGPHIPGSEDFPQIWARDAAEFRSVTPHDLDYPYGPGGRERYDLFFPEGDAKGLMVFVHGGYWLSFDKSFWSHLAGGAVAHGWSAMLPSYDLCPDVTIPVITRQIGAAITHAAQREPGPIVLVGHSAGGHLAARMMGKDAPLGAGIAERIRRAVGISGLYDLRPLMKTAMNERLKLDNAVAETESPILLEPRSGAEMIAWVGAGERPEFLRQSKEFAAAWAEKGAHTEYVEDKGKHHFDVIEGLAQPGSKLIGRALAD